MGDQFDPKKIQEDISKLKQFIKDIENVGGKMPALKTAVNRLEIAINAGVDLAEAADQTSRELRAYTEDLYRACGSGEDKWVCQAGIDRKWQARSVEWNLSWQKKDSTVRRFVRATLCRYAPEFIAKRLAMCKAVVAR